MRPAFVVTTFGFFAVLFEGYDLIVYGAAVPALLAYKPWSLSAPAIGAIGSAALLGMVFGAPASGWLADRFGRRKLFIGLLSFFSLAMVFASIAQTPMQFGVFRFLSGLGFGGIPPTSVALVIELSPGNRKALLNSIMLAGFAVGAIFAGGLAAALLARVGFRALFAVGAVPLLTVVPLAVCLLPESPHFQNRFGRKRFRQNHSVAQTSIFRGRTGAATTLFSVATFLTFLMVFGLSIWLPVLMHGVGYRLSSALLFLVLLNVGALVGGISGSWLADRAGIQEIAIFAFVICAISMGLLAAIPTSTSTNIALVLVIGAALGAAQNVLTSFAATYYSTACRASALGLISGIGRLGAAAGPTLGGMLIGSGAGLIANVAVLSATSIITAIIVLLVPQPAPCENVDNGSNAAPSSDSSQQNLVASRESR
ncbi:MFS transporter [Paraburkholderia sp.]|uniref:MFS transporter n=1 Tax=Paraburkholderia sp. TaxID=1926495 RepID=UPI002D480F9F|nr:MFS transporter [Paraburkholderia sp.]HZZ04920.1 MFS transporter [Paraburkholderia sp.]